MKRFHMITALAGCTVFVTGAGLAAAATPDADVPSVTVRIGDLDLHTDSGVRVLYRRLSAAAAKVCPDPESLDLATLTAMQACRKQAIDRAVNTLSESHLVELRDPRSKRG
jgi:UrcA family protein